MKHKQSGKVVPGQFCFIINVIFIRPRILRMRLSFLSVFLCWILLTVVASSCKKEQLLTSGGSLHFSTDTLSFDTVFTQYASFTLGLKIFNRQKQRIQISTVRLEKGSQSFFNLNVNGIAGNEVKDIEIAAEDSIYVFATVRIDPTNENNPFIVEDRLIATLNGNDFSIPFYAYGQNAHYVVDSVLNQDAVWGTDKPYVILHSALVSAGKTLTLEPGCRIYMHADSRLYVQGRLIANGTRQDSIIFQGNRLDRGYFGNEGYPGEWGGIYFDSSSTGNELSWVIIRNCGNNSGGGLPFAIEVYGQPGLPVQLTMKNTIIENSIGYGIISFHGNIKAQNSLIHSCGAQALAILQGGRYEMDNCNFIIYAPPKLSHMDNPTVALLNYFDISNTERIIGDLYVRMRNCVIYGSLADELFCNRQEEALYDVQLEHCYIQQQEALPDYVLQTGNIFAATALPGFEELLKQNFRLTAGSVLRDAGIPIPGLGNDLDDNPRPQGAMDIGCYEYQ